MLLIHFKWILLSIYQKVCVTWGTYSMLRAPQNGTRVKLKQRSRLKIMSGNITIKPLGCTSLLLVSWEMLQESEQCPMFNFINFLTDCSLFLTSHNGVLPPPKMANEAKMTIMAMHKAMDKITFMKDPAEQSWLIRRHFHMFERRRITMNKTILVLC